MEFIGQGIEDEEAVQRRLQGYLSDQQMRGWTKWRVQDKRGETVGRAGFGLMEDGHHRELGYLLKPELWGQGLATELARALVRWHFAHLDPELGSDLFAYAVTQNTASLRVLEKVGFQRIEEKRHEGRQHTFFVLRAPNI